MTSEKVVEEQFDRLMKVGLATGLIDQAGPNSEGQAQYRLSEAGHDYVNQLADENLDALMAFCAMGIQTMPKHPGLPFLLRWWFDHPESVPKVEAPEAAA